MIIKDYPAAKAEADACKGGRRHCADISPEARHLLLLDVHKAAVYVLKAPDAKGRAYRLSRAPSTIRPLIEAEVARLVALSTKAVRAPARRGYLGRSNPGEASGVTGQLAL